MWENTVTIHGILKENNYKAKFLTSSILKKVKSIKIILEKIIKKTYTKKNHIEKHCNNQQCFKEKKYKTKFSINLILKK